MRYSGLGLVLGLLVAANPAAAHFGMVLPSDTMVTQEDGREIELRFGFAHPFTPEGLELVAPQSVEVFHSDGVDNITETLKAEDFHGAAGFAASYTLGRPGVYTFVMQPEPYWEEAEQTFIQHFSKTHIAAFDDDSGWDAELGLKTEIVPLTKPFGLWAGNLFQGIVKFDGKPVPFAEIEVEHYNETGLGVPNEIMVTQTVKADANGVFSYATPSAGWWGFAALKTANYSLPRDDQAMPVELGAVIWVKFEEWEQ